MRVLLIADVHANYRALAAVLDRFGNADEIWFVGDIVSYGPSPLECIDTVRQRCTHVVRGNHDLRCYLDGYGAPESYAAYLEHLPESLSVTLEGRSYLLSHSPPGHGAYITADAAPALLGEIGRSFREDVLLFGHSHVAMILEAAGKLLVNVGTVGQPRDGDARAQCMVLQDGRLAFHRVEYDLDALEADYRRSPLPRDVQDQWMGWSRAGFVDIHGLQRGPFSAPPDGKPTT